MQACINGIRSCGEYLGHGINTVSSYSEGLTQTTGAVANTMLGTFASMYNQASNLAKKMTITEPAFERGPGFWTQPTDEKIKSFFGSLTDINSQRENWYSVSPYIGEFWCTVSNVGFIYVGIKHQSPEMLFAGVASALSHSIPKQWLLTVDKIGVVVVLSKLVREYQVVIKHPWLFATAGLAGVINLADSYLARQHGQTIPHVVWHLSSALLADIFLSYANQ